MSLISSVFGRVFSRFGGRSSASAPARMRSSSRIASRLRKTVVDLEQLEQRTALTAVSAPSMSLAVASNTGLKNDQTTRLPQPLFVGTAPKGTRVFVANGADVIGSAVTNASGRWSLATPAAKAFLDGVKSLTATAVNLKNPSEASSPTSFRLTIDRLAPQLAPGATGLSYDSAAGITVRFSEKVLGMSLAKLQLTVPGNPSLPLNNAQVTASTNGFTLTRPNDTTYAYKPVVLPYVPGTYTVALLKTGITDIAGNPLAIGRSYQFTSRYPGS